MLRHHLCVLSVLSFFLALPVRTESPASVKTKTSGEVVQLDEENWTQVLNGDWMVEFHAPWCPACREFQPEFKRFAEWVAQRNLKAAAVDVHKYPGLSGRFLISALPTIYHVKDGVFRQYTGVRDRERMVRFIDDEGWTKLDPVSSWLQPDAFHMGIVGSFFKLSMQLKNIHTWMVDEKGLPNWLTYVIFAVGTITLGGLIGVLLVVVIEAITGKRNTDSAPAKKKAPKIVERKKPDSGSSRSGSPSESGSGTEGSANEEAALEEGEESANSGSASDIDEGSGSENAEDGAAGDHAAGSRPDSEPETQATDTNVRRRKARRED